MIKEYETAFKFGDKVIFKHNNKQYLGTVESLYIDKNDALQYDIISGCMIFKRYEYEIEEYEEPHNSRVTLVGNQFYFESNKEQPLVFSSGILSAKDINGINTNNGNTQINLETGKFAIENDDSLTEFKTEGNCYFSIFPDDVEEDSVHIEIDPTWLWTKEDVWELVTELLYNVGEIDEDGNILEEKGESEEVDLDAIDNDFNGILTWIGENKREVLRQTQDFNNKEITPKKLLVLKAPGNISNETHDLLKENLRNTLKAANINAEPLVLCDGLHAYFLET